MSHDNVTAVHAMYDAPILQRIAREREAQQSKWGEQTYPLGDFVATGELSSHHVALLNMHERTAKEVTAAAASAGQVTWADILYEELAEALTAPTKGALCEELIQVAAVCVAMVRDVRRTLTP